MIGIIVAIFLIISGSIGVNYYNRLADCDSSSVESGGFGRIFSIICVVVGVLAVVVQVAMMFI